MIMLVDPQTDVLHGFSTQMLLEVESDGVLIKALFSGDTIVSQERWGETALTRTWARLALSLIDQYAPEPAVLVPDFQRLPDLSVPPAVLSRVLSAFRRAYAGLGEETSWTHLDGTNFRPLTMRPRALCGPARTRTG